MPKSYCRVIVHAVFSTRNRVPVLDAELRPGLFAYMAGILENQGCLVIRIGGHDDHIHALYSAAKMVTIPKNIEHLKTGSSAWIKTKRTELADFHWQAGYGAFSVGNAEVDSVARYIDRQDVHHSKQTFQEEYRKILRSMGIEFDEVHLWD